MEGEIKMPIIKIMVASILLGLIIRFSKVNLLIAGPKNVPANGSKPVNSKALNDLLAYGFIAGGLLLLAAYLIQINYGIPYIDKAAVLIYSIGLVLVIIKVRSHV